MKRHENENEQTRSGFITFKFSFFFFFFLLTYRGLATSLDASPHPVSILLGSDYLLRLDFWSASPRSRRPSNIVWGDLSSVSPVVSIVEPYLRYFPHPFYTCPHTKLLFPLHLVHNLSFHLHHIPNCLISHSIHSS